MLGIAVQGKYFLCDCFHTNSAEFEQGMQLSIQSWKQI